MTLTAGNKNTGTVELETGTVVVMRASGKTQLAIITKLTKTTVRARYLDKPAMTPACFHLRNSDYLNETGCGGAQLIIGGEGKYWKEQIEKGTK